MKIDRNAAEWRVVEGEVVGLDLGKGEYFALNPSGAALWSRLAEGADEDALVAELQQTFSLSAEQARADVVSFVAVLRERGLLEGENV